MIHSDAKPTHLVTVVLMVASVVTTHLGCGKDEKKRPPPMVGPEPKVEPPTSNRITLEDLVACSVGVIAEVHIEGRSEPNILRSSGVLLDNGLILTNRHAVTALTDGGRGYDGTRIALKISVHRAGKNFVPAEIAAVSLDADLALLKPAFPMVSKLSFPSQTPECTYDEELHVVGAPELQPGDSIRLRFGGTSGSHIKLIGNTIKPSWSGAVVARLASGGVAEPIGIVYHSYSARPDDARTGGLAIPTATIARFIEMHSHFARDGLRSGIYQVTLDQCSISASDRQRVRGTGDTLSLRVQLRETEEGPILGQWPTRDFQWDDERALFSVPVLAVEWRPGMRLRLEVLDVDTLSGADLIGVREWNQPPQDSVFPLQGEIELEVPSSGGTTVKLTSSRQSSR